MAEASFIVHMLYKDIILVTHFFTILLLRYLDCFISRPISTTLYRCYFAFCQSSLNEYEYEYESNAHIVAG